MIDARIISEVEREYVILGSTGNVYTATIGTLHGCTCHDFRFRRSLCKHILFVLIKVLRVNTDSFYVYQHGLLTTELKKVFRGAPSTLFGVVAADRVRRKYRNDPMSESEEKEMEVVVERKEKEGNDCPVCMEEFESGDDAEAITWCQGQCGNNVHVQCFEQWEANQLANHQEVVCMFCRTPWLYPSDTKKKAKDVGEKIEFSKQTEITINKKVSLYIFMFMCYK